MKFIVWDCNDSSINNPILVDTDPMIHGIGAAEREAALMYCINKKLTKPTVLRTHLLNSSIDSPYNSYVFNITPKNSYDIELEPSLQINWGK